jgi:protein-disulfide isomerase/uncharacterized membrane protein
VCNIGAFDCDTVNTSIYSELGGRPIALWGAALNAFIALLLLWNAFGGADRLARYAFYISIFGAVVSVVMGYLAYAHLKVICLFCSAVYVSSFITVVSLAIYTGKNRFSEIAEDIKALFQKGAEGSFSVLVTGLVIAIAPVFMVHGMMMDAHGKRLQWAIPESISTWKSAKENKFLEEGALTKGAAADKAAITLVEFADFRCPHCKTAVPSLHSFVKSHPDVRLVFLNFPLDSGCNPAMEHPGASCGLAKAVYCANKSGKGWEAHDWLFENQGKVTGADVSGLVSAVGLNADEFKVCTESSQTHDAIVAQAVLGKSADVQGTPAIYANGRILPEGFLIPILNAVYSEIVKK